MASDVARYNVLHNHGGIYADLDLTPKEDFQFPSGDALKSGQLPFVGPMIRDKSSLGGENVKKVMGNKYGGGELGNHLIAAEAGNKTMNKVINKIGGLKIASENDDTEYLKKSKINAKLYKNDRKKLSNNKDFLAEDAPLFTGSQALSDVMIEQMGKQGPFAHGAIDQMNSKTKKAFDPDNFNWVTDASQRNDEDATIGQAGSSNAQADPNGKGKRKLR